MSVLDKDVIDSIGTNSETGSVNLIISDHLGWGEETESHLLALQEKINTYIRYIESSEIYSSFPSAIGKNLVINIYCKFPPIEECRNFFSHVQVILESIGIGFAVTDFSSKNI
ncbi:DUF6572 domain-containing protein [Herbaspirillum aquaticum]|uniref:DUF6572 domain-containing protein n=1 Tax=Herbaspirillum aquaticum TaxID=568783 RepID=UPI00113233DA|nr:DUF6572 domain-containing protein [Herbaspirillum aquaticum]